MYLAQGVTLALAWFLAINVISSAAIAFAARRLRRRGLVPGVLYGREQPVAITIPERDLRAALTTRGGLNAVLDVVVESGNTHSSVQPSSNSTRSIIAWR